MKNWIFFLSFWWSVEPNLFRPRSYYLPNGPYRYLHRQTDTMILIEPNISSMLLPRNDGITIPFLFQLSLNQLHQEAWASQKRLISNSNELILNDTKRYKTRWNRLFIIHTFYEDVGTRFTLHSSYYQLYIGAIILFNRYSRFIATIACNL